MSPGPWSNHPHKRENMSPRADYKYAITPEEVDDLFVRSLIKRAPFFIQGWDLL
jgi:hypothetical protein